MLKISHNIFVFKEVIPLPLIDRLISLQDSNSEKFRVDINIEDFDLFLELDRFWKEKIEPPYLDDYLQIYDIDAGIGYNSNPKVVEELKEYVRAKWRDMFLLRYNTENSKEAYRNVHWDFSGLSFIGCLSSEYEGGDLFFPRQNVGYKLELGDIIIFPGGLSHPHYVNPTIGVRNVLVGQSLTLPQAVKIDY